MPVRDLSTIEDTVTSTDPVETIRTFVRLRRKAAGLDPATVIGYGGKDPLDGRLRQADIGLDDLDALCQRIEEQEDVIAELRSQIDGTAEAVARDRQREWDSGDIVGRTSR